MSRLRRHTISFKHALDGLIYTFRSQPNFQVHSIAAVLVILIGLFFHLNSIEWLIITFVIGLVLIAEMINTSFESVIDLLTSQYHESAKIAKDVSAGMVLVTAIIAIITGLWIFLPHLLPLLHS